MEGYGEDGRAARLRARRKSSITSTSTSGGSSKTQSSGKRRRKGAITINLFNCRYDILRDIAKNLGWRSVEDESDDWTIYWTDTSVSTDRVMYLKKYQRINHFPGMSEISRKNHLARNLGRMAKAFPEEYDFFPRTWVLPNEFADLASYVRKQGKKAKSFIVKPDAGCQGKGIFLTRSLDDMASTENAVAQQYVSKPLLIDGYKFDMRVYVLITSCDPLRVYVFRDGLARFATEQYEEPNARNVANRFMHLTNYSVNKQNEAFIQNNGSEEAAAVASKRSLIAVFNDLNDQGYDAEKIWRGVQDLAVKTLIAIQPTLAHLYNSSLPNDTSGSACFEILGLDVMLDRKMKPWLLEVNHSPSFNTDSRLDWDIKSKVIEQALQMLNLSPADKRRYLAEEKLRVQQRLFSRQVPRTPADQDEVRRSHLARAQHEDTVAGSGYDRVYPPDDADLGAKYDMLAVPARSLFGETIASQARRRANEKKAEKQQEEMLRAQGRFVSRSSSKDGSNKNGVGGSGTTGSSASSSSLRHRSSGSIAARFPRTVGSFSGTSIGAADPTVFAISGLPAPQGVRIDEGEERIRIGEKLMRDNLVRCSGIRDKLVTILSAPPPDPWDVPAGRVATVTATKPHDTGGRSTTLPLAAQTAVVTTTASAYPYVRLRAAGASTTTATAASTTMTTKRPSQDGGSSSAAAARPVLPATASAAPDAVVAQIGAPAHASVVPLPLSPFPRRSIAASDSAGGSGSHSSRRGTDTTRKAPSINLLRTSGLVAVANAAAIAGSSVSGSSTTVRRASLGNGNGGSGSGGGSISAKASAPTAAASSSVDYLHIRSIRGRGDHRRA